VTHVRNLIQSEPSNWLSILTDQFHIHAVIDGDLVSLKYNQLESPMHEPIVQECRGMVVHIPTGTILAHPYNKFWNLGEVLAAPIDWSTARVLEKLDGSLMTLYHHGGEWCVASSGHPTAGGSYGDAEGTFRDAFWKAWGHLNMDLPNLYDEVCFMFEFCANEHRIVCRHDKPRIVLHGARNLVVGSECPWVELRDFASDHNWEMVQSYKIENANEALASADSLDPIQTEGFVVVDAAFNRVKIKSPRYVALHHMKGEATLRRAIELWQTGETDEVLAHFPELAPKILPVQQTLEHAARLAHDDLKKVAVTSRKDFAAIVKSRPWSAACFRHFDDRDLVTVHDVTKTLRSQSLASLERLVETLGVSEAEVQL
jgi:hypothetical protein